MTNYKLYSAATATADGSASLDVVQDGKIQGISFVIAGLAGAGVNGRGRCEVSFASSSSFVTNDTRNQICQCSFSMPVNTGGFNQVAYFALPDIQANQGERIYLHFNLAGTAPSAMDTTVFLHTMDSNKNSRVRL